MATAVARVINTCQLQDQNMTHFVDFVNKIYMMMSSIFILATASTR